MRTACSVIIGPPTALVLYLGVPRDPLKYGLFMFVAFLLLSQTQFIMIISLLRRALKASYPSVLLPQLPRMQLLAASSTTAAPLAVAAPPGPDTLASRAVSALLPPFMTVWTQLPSLIPSIVFVGKKTRHGKNKRVPSKANHGARPCSHVGRRQRAAARGKYKYNPWR